MSEKDLMDQEEIHSKVLRAGRRTYFFDVRSTRAGDYYLTITESKKFTHEDGSFHYKKHKIYLYKEDFEAFHSHLSERVRGNLGTPSEGFQKTGFGNSLSERFSFRQFVYRPGFRRHLIENPRGEGSRTLATEISRTGS